MRDHGSYVPPGITNSPAVSHSIMATGKLIVANLHISIQTLSELSLLDQNANSHQAIDFTSLQQLPLYQGHHSLGTNFNQEAASNVQIAISDYNTWGYNVWLNGAATSDQHLHFGPLVNSWSTTNVAVPQHSSQTSTHAIPIQAQKSRVQCTTCPRKPTFGCMKDLERHRRTSSAHFGEGTQFYQCRCGQRTARKDNHKRHIEHCSGSSRTYTAAIPESSIE